MSIRIENVSKQFGGFKALDDVSVDVREGELLALVAHFKGKGAFGADKELQLLAFAWDKAAGVLGYFRKCRSISWRPSSA